MEIFLFPLDTINQLSNTESSRLIAKGKDSLVSATYLDEAEHPIMEGRGGVEFGQNGMHQHAFSELLRRHQDVEAVATVLHTGLENLRHSDAAQMDLNIMVRIKRFF